jgi:hypothetical protein
MKTTITLTIRALVLLAALSLNFIILQPALAQVTLLKKKPWQNFSSNLPKGIALSTALSKNTYNYHDDIPVTIKLTNNSGKTQNLLLNKIPSYGPWQTSINIINVKTGKSAVQYQSRAILSSQVYFDDDLKKYQYQVLPGASISATVSLYGIIVVNFNDNYNLPKGEYQMQLTYYNISSKKIKFKVI